MAKKSAPGTTRRLSVTRLVTTRSASPRNASTVVPASRFFKVWSMRAPPRRSLSARAARRAASRKGLTPRLFSRLAKPIKIVPFHRNEVVAPAGGLGVGLDAQVIHGIHGQLLEGGGGNQAAVGRRVALH